LVCSGYGFILCETRTDFSNILMYLRLERVQDSSTQCRSCENWTRLFTAGKKIFH